MGDAGLVPQSAICVLVADRTPMGTSLLADALRRDRHLQVLTAFTNAELCDQIRSHAPGVLVISTDHEEQSEDGFSLVRQLWRDYPGLRIIILLDSPRRDLVVNALRAGASGIFCRVDPIQALRKCVYRVHSGQIWASNRDVEYVLQVLRETAHLRIVDSHGDPLSARDQDIIHLVAAGLSNCEISEQLKLSEHTVKNYLARIYHKLGVSTRAEVIFYGCTYLRREGAEAEESLLAALNSNAPQKVQKMAEQGFVLAQYLLARMYQKGTGMPRDNFLAYKWYCVAEETSRQVSLRTRSQKELLENMLTADEVSRAEHAGLDQFCEFQQQTDPGLWGEVPPMPGKLHRTEPTPIRAQRERKRNSCDLSNVIRATQPG